MASWGKMLGSSASMAGTGAALTAGNPIGIGAGALLGLGMGLFGSNEEEANRRRQAELRAAEIEASPWTHQAPQTPVEFSKSNGAADAVQGLATGMQAVQGAEQNKQAAETGQLWNDLLKKQINAPQAPGAFQAPQMPWSYMSKSPTFYGMNNSSYSN